MPKKSADEAMEKMNYLSRPMSVANLKIRIEGLHILTTSETNILDKGGNTY